MIHYFPIEHEPMRYTASLDAHIVKHLEHSVGRARYIRYDTLFPFNRELPAGQFLDAARTIAYKATQIAMLANAYAAGEVLTGDTVFLGDMWFPGIESVRYLDFFEKRKVKLHGILHAGSFTDTDFVRQLERWAAPLENAWFDMFDRIIVASEFMKREVCSRRLVQESKIVVSAFPLDARAVKPKAKRENTVLFNGRLCAEKQPMLFEELEFSLKDRGMIPRDTVFVNTQKQRFTQEVYYDVMKRAKAVVSFALQENFGFAVAEATMCGCVPCVPNRLVYPEFYPASALYHHWRDLCDNVAQAVNSYDDIYQQSIINHLSERIRPSMDKWL